MSTPPESHRVFIVNEKGSDPYVTPKELAVSPNDRVVFTVVGRRDEFKVRPETNILQSVKSGEEIPVKHGYPHQSTVRDGVRRFTLHRYTVSSTSGEEIDPVLIVY